MISRIGLLKKFPGKGGWTYVETPEVSPDPKAPFGWVVVSGEIDNYSLNKVKLLPMGGGKLFLPVKAEIRKIIRKQAGDQVLLKLRIDHTPATIPEELKACFENEPVKVYENFLQLPESRKHVYLKHIYSAKTDETKIKRIVDMLDELAEK